MNTDPTNPTPSGPAQPVEDDDAKIEKWFWKIDYCKKNGIPPADEQCWQIAEQKWEQRNDPPTPTPPQPAPESEAPMPVQNVSPKIAIPFAMLLPHQRQAMLNHNQTLQRLRERGGLSPCEAMAILTDRHWHRMDRDEAIQELTKRITDYKS